MRPSSWQKKVWRIRQLQNPESPMMGCDAFWNTFWNLNRLWGLVTPETLSQGVRSQLQLDDDGGWLPKGPGGLRYSGVMVGEHDIALIVAAWQKGIRNFDGEKAFARWTISITSPAALRIAALYGTHQWVISVRDIATAREREIFRRRRRKGFLEGTAWQYSFYVSHNMKGLIQLMCREELVRRLNQGFEDPRPNFARRIVDLGNEENMQAPWVFNCAGAPWLTQKWARGDESLLLRRASRLRRRRG